MKKITLLFSLIFVVAFLTQAQYDMPTMGGVGGTGVQQDTMPPVGFPYPTVFNFNYSTINNPSMNAGTVGAMFFAGKYYFNRWNSTLVHRYNGNGPGGGPGTYSDSVTYVGSCRDLTTDGMYIYGGNASTTLYRFSPSNMATLKTFTLTGGSTRAVAWDPNRKVFWNTNFGGNIFMHDTNGVLKGQLVSALAGKYGMSFDSIPGQPAYLWVWNQGTGSTTNELVKVDILTGNALATYVFTLTGASIGIAGGMEICQVGTRRLLLANYQNFALVGYNFPLIPVEFTGLAANVVDGKVILNWSTATETNNQGFEVQRKIDGQFVTIGFVNGKGTTTEKQNYSFIDSKVIPGKQIYRLKQVDYSGTISILKTIEVDVVSPTTFSLNQNYPNPFNPTTVISFSLAVDSKVTLTVYNAIGKEVMTLANNNFAAGNHNINFDARNLNSGIYLYKIQATGIDGSSYSSVKKMIFNK